MAASTATFAFSSEDPLATFTCAVDAGPAAPCTSPHEVTVADGAHTFSVSAVDALGVAGPPATREWTADTTAPETDIFDGPSDGTQGSGPVGAGEAFFVLRAAGDASGFECAISPAAGDPAAVPAWAPCSARFPVPAALADGTYDFSARAADAAGNVDATPSVRRFLVDRTPPRIIFPADLPAVVGTPTLRLTFTVEGAKSSECELDDEAVPCEGGSYVTPPLRDGERHVFTVRAADGARNTARASHAFRVDTTPPDTRITSFPAASASPSFSFESTEAGSRFECRMDAGPWEACASPKAYRDLPAGGHAFAVRAIDAVGHVDPTEARQAFTVPGAAVVAVQGTPPGPVAPRPPAAPMGDRRGPRISIPSSNATLRVSSRGVVSFAIGPVREPVSGVLGLRTTGRVRTEGGRRSVVSLGTAFIRSPARRRATVALRLTRSALATLRRNGRLKVRATITLRDRVGNSTSRVYIFTLRR